MEWQGRKSVQFSIFDATFLMKFSYLSNLGDEEKIRKEGLATLYADFALF